MILRSYNNTSYYVETNELISNSIGTLLSHIYGSVFPVLSLARWIKLHDKITLCTRLECIMRHIIIFKLKSHYRNYHFSNKIFFF